MDGDRALDFGTAHDCRQSEFHALVGWDMIKIDHTGHIKNMLHGATTFLTYWVGGMWEGIVKWGMMGDRFRSS